jgi:glycosyltransferase involved in cell wall biosynthesis
VVDDLSTDDSFKIAQIYAKRDPEHFVAIQLEKKGYAGAARNKGLDYPIESDYLIFLDSDDYLYSDNSLHKLHRHILESNYPDLVRCKSKDAYGIHYENANPEKFVFMGSAPWKNVINSKF